MYTEKGKYATHTNKSKTAFLKPVVFIYIAKLLPSEDEAKFSLKKRNTELLKIFISTYSSAIA